MLGLITLHKKSHPLISVEIVKGIGMRQAMRLSEFSHTGHKIRHSIPKLLATHTSKQVRVVTRSLSRLEIPRIFYPFQRFAVNRRTGARDLSMPYHIPVVKSCSGIQQDQKSAGESDPVDSYTTLMDFHFPRRQRTSDPTKMTTT